MQDRRLQRVYIQRDHRGSEAAVLVPQRARMLSPVALRPVTPAYPPRRSMVDRLLLLGEWTAAIVLIAFAGYQFVDGPVRDWLHEPRASTRAAAAPETVVNQSTPLAKPTVATARHVDVPQQTASDRLAASASTLHPELGYTLPSVGEKWRRPAVAPDYLQPARDFVPAAAVPPPSIVEQAPPPTPVPAADPRPTHLYIPGVGIDTSVEEVFLVDGVWQVADYAAGYLHGTGVAGSGNVVMAGHQGIRGAVFATLEAMKPGNDVFVDTATQRYHYRVRETGSVWPSQVSVMFPSATPTLTLMTCTNWDMQRFVVIADLVDTAALPESVSQ